MILIFIKLKWSLYTFTTHNTCIFVRGYCRSLGNQMCKFKIFITNFELTRDSGYKLIPYEIKELCYKMLLHNLEIRYFRNVDNYNDYIQLTISIPIELSLNELWKVIKSHFKNQMNWTAGSPIFTLFTDKYNDHYDIITFNSAYHSKMHNKAKFVELLCDKLNPIKKWKSVSQTKKNGNIIFCFENVTKLGASDRATDNYINTIASEYWLYNIQRKVEIWTKETDFSGIFCIGYLCDNGEVIRADLV
eukprot:440131_1